MRPFYQALALTLRGALTASKEGDSRKVNEWRHKREYLLDRMFDHARMSQPILDGMESSKRPDKFLKFFGDYNSPRQGWTQFKVEVRPCLEQGVSVQITSYGNPTLRPEDKAQVEKIWVKALLRQKNWLSNAHRYLS